jgi:MFS transporter, ACS family, D-galactonate transporter
MVHNKDNSQSLRSFRPVLALLAICVFFNYIDRGNLSIAAPLLKDELGISASQLGILLAAFFWTYTAMQFVTGWLVDRFGVNWVIAAGFLLWSLATATSGFVRGFTVLLAMRLMLGMGESVAFPACAKILARHVPEHQRGFANGIIGSAFRFGNAIASLGGGLMMARYGWRSVFIGMGLVGLLWLPAWMRWMPSGGTISDSIVKTPSVGDIMRQRSFWGTCLGSFCGSYQLYFMMTWLPFYLVRQQHLSMQSMAKIAGVYYLVDAVSSIVGGRLSDVWIQKHYAPTLVRKTTMGIGVAIKAIALAGCTASPRMYLPWLIAIGVGSGIGGASGGAVSQTLAGPAAAGRWYGLQNGFANVAGIIGPALTGFMVERTGTFTAAMTITTLLTILGGLAWLCIVGRVEQVKWGTRRDALVAVTSTPRERKFAEIFEPIRAALTHIPAGARASSQA